MPAANPVLTYGNRSSQVSKGYAGKRFRAGCILRKLSERDASRQRAIVTL
jgi:hypothetical protein